MKALRHYLIPLCIAVLTLAAGPVAISPALAEDTWTPLGKGWARYTNERFGTTVEIPRYLFKPAEPPPANGDGREFKSADGARLWISASYGPSVVTDTFQEYKAWLLEHTGLDRLTYKAEGNSWLVLSGIKGDNIVYRKVLEGCGAAHELHVEYPVRSKALYDSVVARLSRSINCNSHDPRPSAQRLLPHCRFLNRNLLANPSRLAGLLPLTDYRTQQALAKHSASHCW